jgi:hypothetical protein
MLLVLGFGLAIRLQYGVHRATEPITSLEHMWPQVGAQPYLTNQQSCSSQFSKSFLHKLDPAGSYQSLLGVEFSPAGQHLE